MFTGKAGAAVWPPGPGRMDVIRKVKKERINELVRVSLNTNFWTQTKERSVTYDGFQIWGF